MTDWAVKINQAPPNQEADLVGVATRLAETLHLEASITPKVEADLQWQIVLGGSEVGVSS